MDSRFDGSLLAGSWDRFEHLAPDMCGAEVVTRRIRMPDGRHRSLPADGHEIEALQNGGAGMDMQECQALVRRIRLSTAESWHQDVMMVQGAAKQRGNRSFHQWW